MANAQLKESRVSGLRSGIAMIFAGLMVGPAVIAGQTESARAPHSAKELAERYRIAHDDKNVAAIQRLFFWGGATEQTKALVRSFIEHDVGDARVMTTNTCVGADASHVASDDTACLPGSGW